jgi:peptidoglycan/LPS O-acetylase OafA/YrhL
MGAFGLGLITAWVHAGSLRRRFFWSYAALVALAIAVDFRSRLLVALTTALLLMVAARFDWLGNWPRSPLVRWVAGISYSLFLVHFPVSLVVNALWFRHVPGTPGLSLLGMCTAYALSMLVAVLFHHQVERRLVRFGRAARVRPAAT